jgi:hypothetical protein
MYNKMAGPSSSQTHGTRALRKAVENQHMTFDMWCGRHGYKRPVVFEGGGPLQGGGGGIVCAVRSGATDFPSSEH